MIALNHGLPHIALPYLTAPTDWWPNSCTSLNCYPHWAGRAWLVSCATNFKFITKAFPNDHSSNHDNIILLCVCVHTSHFWTMPGSINDLHVICKMDQLKNTITYLEPDLDLKYPKCQHNHVFLSWTMNSIVLASACDCSCATVAHLVSWRRWCRAGWWKDQRL